MLYFRPQYPRKSAERFGDDLLGLILKPLCLLDKLRLQYMSRQTSRVIFEHQNKLGLVKSFRDYLIREANTRCILSNNFDEFVYKKLKNLRHLTISPSFHSIRYGISYLTHEMNEFARVFMKYDYNFKSFTYSPILYYKKNLDDLARKYSKSIEKLEIIHSNAQAKLSHLRNFTNLKELELVTDFHIHMNTLFDYDGSSFVRNLKAITFSFSDSEFDLLIKFFDYNLTLEDVTLLVCISFAPMSRSRIIDQLARLDRLRKLSISLILDNTQLKYFGKFKMLATKCKALKCLSLIVYTDSDHRNGELLNELLSMLNNFKQLKSLSIRYEGFILPEKISIKELRNLTDLERFVFEMPIPFRFSVINDLSKNFPNLKFLQLKTIEFNEHCYIGLIKCKKLQTIVLHCLDNLWPNLYRQRLKELFEKIPKLQFLLFNNKYI